MNFTEIITIDGPAGSGKSTLAKSLAKAMGWKFLDTGALYRAVAFAVYEKGFARCPFDEVLIRFISQLPIAVQLAAEESRVFLAEREVTGYLRAENISILASKVSAVPAARLSLRELQRKLGREGRLVTEGRDQGTALFPEAKLKFYLSAAAKERARRRRAQMIRQSLSPPPLDKILQDIMLRDYQDSHREVDPLLEPADSVRVDSTDLTLEGVLQIMLEKAREVFPGEFASQ
ncbi:MAG: (d)CMP kinase [Deltaproteobacteria bacterium]|jgi:cytidylate kinase|nr:(d)CMP kinase [Deltaproteobacteria bacterium]